jgi:hypothetical protein
MVHAAFTSAALERRQEGNKSLMGVAVDMPRRRCQIKWERYG